MNEFGQMIIELVDDDEIYIGDITIALHSIVSKGINGKKRVKLFFKAPLKTEIKRKNYKNKLISAGE